MRGHQQRRAMLMLRQQKSVDDPLAVVKVLSAGWFIENQQRWLAGQRLRERYPLCLPQRKFGRRSRPAVCWYPQSR